MSSPFRKAEIAAAVAVGLLGVPLAIGLATAFADGERRRREAPLRAMLGDAAYAALTTGEATTQHYLGQDRTVPDFELRDARGRPVRMADYRGRVVVLNFWTVTCAPCIEELPSFVELAQLLEGRDDIALLTIAADRSWDAVRAVLPEDSRLPVVLDPDRAVVRGQFGTRLYPETWVIDPHGVIRLRIDGARDWSTPVALDLLESFL